MMGIAEQSGDDFSITLSTIRLRSSRNAEAWPLKVSVEHRIAEDNSFAEAPCGNEVRTAARRLAPNVSPSPFWHSRMPSLGMNFLEYQLQRRLYCSIELKDIVGFRAAPMPRDDPVTSAGLFSNGFDIFG